MDFVDFNVAKKLKEKGFNEECLCHYIDEDLIYNIESPITNNQLWFSHNKFNNIWHKDNVDAPTVSQVLKWLIDKKNIYIETFLYNRKYSYLIKSTTKICEDDLFHECLNDDTSDDEYEDPKDAMLAGIKYVLDNLI